MEANKPRMRKHLCLPSLLKRARQRFSYIKDSTTRQVNISLTDWRGVKVRAFWGHGSSGLHSVI
jgi:hypothetical protein